MESNLAAPDTWNRLQPFFWWYNVMEVQSRQHCGKPIYICMALHIHSCMALDALGCSLALRTHKFTLHGIPAITFSFR